MTERLKQRLVELENEFFVGENQLKDLENKKRALENQLLRIDGAITIIKEIVDENRKQEETKKET